MEYAWSPPDFDEEERRRQVEEALAARFAPEAPPPAPAPPQAAPPLPAQARQRGFDLAEQAVAATDYDSDPEYLAAKRQDYIGGILGAAGHGGRIAMQALTGQTFAPEARRSAVEDYVRRKSGKVDDLLKASTIMANQGSAREKGGVVVTEDDVNRAIEAGVPEKVARAAMSDPQAFRALLVKYAEPQDPEKVKPNLEQHKEYVRRGAALKSPVLPTDGEKPADFAKRVEAQEARESGGVEKVSDSARNASVELRKEFNGLQVVKDMESIATAYKKIQTTSNSGAGDISLIYNYMRLMDPGSTVREGEFATAANAGSVPQSIIAKYNAVVNGEKLSPEVRAQFKAESEKPFRVHVDRYHQAASEYRRISKQMGLDPTVVVRDMGLPKRTVTIDGKTYEEE